MSLTHLSLFSGIGGLDLAAEMAGFTTVGQCEWADYPTKVLEHHWPDVARWRDIRTLTKESFYERTRRHTVTVVSGGFPCQPFSVAGYKKGADDDRYLWPEMLRVIGEIKPAWVLGENVAGIDDGNLDKVCRGLEDNDYCITGIFEIPACLFGANHERYRVFIVANSKQRRWQEFHAKPDSTKSVQRGRPPKETDFGVTAEGLYRLADCECLRKGDGVPDRVDRLKGLGNAVVPQQAYPIFAAIAEIERYQTI